MALREAVGNLYAVFGRYPLNPRMSRCDHCHSDEDQARLGSRPLRELDVEDLDDYAFSALTTWGEADDFKHFLPRLLELMAFGSERHQGFMAEETLFGKLREAEWSRWPPVERQAVGRYLDELWMEALSSFPGGRDVDALVCCLGQAVDDLAPFLDRWLETPSEAALRHLAGFVAANEESMRTRGVLWNAYWSGRPATMGQAMAWIASPSTRGALERPA